MEKKLNLLMDEINNRFSGTIGAAFYDLESGFKYSYHGNLLLATASTMKIFVLGALLEMVDKGMYKLTDRIELKKGDQVGGSGVLKELDPGLNLTVKDTATLMIIKSDNTATNMCIDLAGGVDAVNNHLKRAGIIESRVGCKIDFEYIGDDYRKLGVATADEFVMYLSKIYKREIVSESMREEFISILKKQQYLDQVPRYLPFNPYAADLGIAIGENDISVANKTGFTIGTRVDVGYIFRGKHPYVYAVMTNDCKDETFAPDNEANHIEGQIGRMFYEHLIL